MSQLRAFFVMLPSATIPRTVPIVKRPFNGRRRFLRVSSTSQTTQEPETEVMPPQTISYQNTSVNAVVLQGSITDAPNRRTSTRTSNLTIDLRLAVPRSLVDTETTNFSYYTLRCYEFCALQAEKYLKAGDAIGVEGRLSGSPYVDVDVRNFALIESGTWPYRAPPAEPPSSRGEGPRRSRDNEERTLMKPYLWESERKVHQAYLAGKTIEDIKKEFNFKESTVLSYLASCAYHGLEMDFEFLARSCLLGPEHSDSMETNTVYAAIRAVKDDQNIENLCDVPVRPVHELLRKERDGQCFQTQEKTISSVTYSQISTVTAMIQRGLQPTDWNRFKTALVTSASSNEKRDLRNSAPF